MKQSLLCRVRKGAFCFAKCFFFRVLKVFTEELQKLKWFLCLLGNHTCRNTSPSVYGQSRKRACRRRILWRSFSSMDCKRRTGRILRRPRGRTVRVRYAGLKFGCRRISRRRGWGCCPCPMTRLPVVGVNQARRRICGPSVPISFRSSSPCIVAYRPTHLFLPSDSLCLSL